MSGGGKQSGTTQTVQKTDSAPWVEQQPYLKYGFEEAQKQYQSDEPSYFPGDTVVGFDPYQSQAQDMVAQRAMAGNPLNQQAQGVAGDTLSGEYLNGNPYFDQMVGSIGDAVRPGVDSQFAGAGRYGSGLHAGTMTDAIARQAAPLAYQNYATERGNQQAMVGAAPGLAATDYADAGMLAGVGAERQNMGQQQLSADIERFNFDQNVDRAKLADFMSLIQGNYGGQTTQTVDQPLYRNRSASMLGGAATGAGAGAAFGPWGAAAGAGLGLLMA